MIAQKYFFDFKMHCTHSTGDGMHSHEDRAINNNRSQRILDFTCLRALLDWTEGHFLLFWKARNIPIQKNIVIVLAKRCHIKKVYSISEHEDIPKGLKIKERNENIYFDSHRMQKCFTTMISNPRVKKRVRK